MSSWRGYKSQIPRGYIKSLEATFTTTASFNAYTASHEHGGGGGPGGGIFTEVNGTQAFTTSSVNIGTDDTPRLMCRANGDIVIGNENSKPVKLNVWGRVGVGVKYPQESLHVDGNIKFSERTFTSGMAEPKEGSWTTGSVVWHERPEINQPVGWICVKGGKPGSWRPFGKIY